MEKRDKESVRLQQASLDEKDNDVVAHGWLDINAINNLRVGDYQREILENRGGRKGSLGTAVENGERLPDIMLGMRGEKFTTKGNDMLLENDVYVVDGLQRISALRKYAADDPANAAKIRIGAEVRFNTTRDSETALFTVLNIKRKAMSPSVVLRNQRNDSEGIATLYGLSLHDRKFALIGKVCWDQQMHRGELMTGMTFAKVAMTLHRHAAPGGRQVGGAGINRNISDILDRMAKATGLQNFRGNLIVMFDAMDEIWGIRGVKYQDRATHVRGNFMVQVAGILSDHEDFWDGDKLVIDADFKRKMKTFPIDDPTIIRLAGAGSTTGDLLRRHLIDYINKGRQISRHLTLRRIDPYNAQKKKKA